LTISRVSHKGRREKSGSAVDTGSEDSDAHDEKVSLNQAIASLKGDYKFIKCFFIYLHMHLDL